MVTITNKKSSPNVFKIMLDIYESMLLFDIENINVLTRTQRANIDKVAAVYSKAINTHGKKEPWVWIWYVNGAGNIRNYLNPH